MNDMTWSERARRRGGISQVEFLAGLDAAGFIERPSASLGVAHEFTHPATGDRRYRVGGGEAYGRATLRLLAELQTGWDHAIPA